MFATCSDAEIAAGLGRSRSTIFRERTRNAANGEYLAVQAQQFAEKRRSNRPLMEKMDRAEINELVRAKITSYWSPEQIAGRLKRDRLDATKRVSQLDGFRRMSPAERVSKMCKLSASLRRMAMDAIRRHPEFDESDVRLKFIELTYGKELADSVRNHLLERELI